MKFAYAFRRTAFYPYDGGTGWEIPPKEVRGKYLKKVREIGFEGIEVGLGQGVGTSEAEIRELGKELDAAGVPCAAVRGGGGFTRPFVADRSRAAVTGAVKMASWIGSNLINMTVTMPSGHPAGLVGGGVGATTAPGASKTATAADYEVTANELRKLADFAADLGVDISIELHQHSIADTSWSCLHLLNLIDRPNVGLNPDLGNLYWHYETPEETLEHAIVALAPKTRYWHCKQLQRVQIPDLEKSYFLLVPLPDGEIDYRFSIAAMLDAGYDGWLSIEGFRYGDQIRGDSRSVAYCKELIAELRGA
ncbi:MAG: sugar phosphate isomerase/epimerase [Thermomicrobiales bacterium]